MKFFSGKSSITNAKIDSSRYLLIAQLKAEARSSDPCGGWSNTKSFYPPLPFLRPSLKGFGVNNYNR